MEARSPAPRTSALLAGSAEAWDAYVGWAERFYASAGFAERELNPHLAAAEQLRRVRSALLAIDAAALGGGARGSRRSGDLTGWQPLLERALVAAAGVLPEATAPVQSRFLVWCAAQPERAHAALKTLWEDAQVSASTAGDRSPQPGQRVRAFLRLVPASVTRGARLSLASYLLIALDPMRFPVYDAEALALGASVPGVAGPPDGADEASVYESALGFLDRLIEEAAARGVRLHHRLHAQGAARCIARGEPALEWTERECEAFRRYLADLRRAAPAAAGAPAAGAAHPRSALARPPARELREERDATFDASRRRTLAELAVDLLLDEPALARIERLLADKGQCIFYGPPGTGKTFVARELARYLAGSDERVQLVQFHPSYAYEDFVEGYRPQLRGGDVQGAGFALVDGPLKRLARAASSSPDQRFLLVVDELNRGNVAKVFGELYYLLEYRGQQVTLQYSAAPFALPPNLWMIGTMNTADRSIALVDLALRRRFYFVPFFPDEPPIEGLLRRWLERHQPEMAWLATVVDRANALLADRHTAIGPSAFLRLDLNEEWVELIWEHSVLPYVAEQLFGEEERLREFDLARLRGAVRRGTPGLRGRLGEDRNGDRGNDGSGGNAPPDAG